MCKQWTVDSDELNMSNVYSIPTPTSLPRICTHILPSRHWFEEGEWQDASGDLHGRHSNLLHAPSPYKVQAWFALLPLQGEFLVEHWSFFVFSNFYSHSGTWLSNWTWMDWLVITLGRDSHVQLYVQVHWLDKFVPCSPNTKKITNLWMTFFLCVFTSFLHGTISNNIASIELVAKKKQLKQWNFHGTNFPPALASTCTIGHSHHLSCLSCINTIPRSRFFLACIKLSQNCRTDNISNRK